MNQKLRAFFSPSAIHGAQLFVAYYHYLGAYDLPDPSPLQQLAAAQADFAHLHVAWVGRGQVHRTEVPLDLDCPLAFFHHELHSDNQLPYRELYAVRLRADWSRQLTRRLEASGARTDVYWFGKVRRPRSERALHRFNAELEVDAL